MNYVCVTGRLFGHIRHSILSLVMRHRSAKRQLVAGLLFVSLFFTGPGSTAEPESPLILGVHPYLSYSALRVRFDPLAQYLTDRLGVPVAVRVGNTYNDHIEEIGQNRIDIAYLGPVGYVQVVNRYGPKPLLARLETNGTVALTGHFIVRDDSPLRQLSDIADRHVGFGDPRSTMSSVLPRAVLKKSGIAIGQQTRYRSHTSIAIAVLSGQVDAGAVKEEVFQQFKEQGLRSLAPLPSVSEHAFVSRTDLPEPMTAQIRSLLLKLDQSEDGRHALKAIHSQASGLRSVSDADYVPLRELLYPETNGDAG